MPTPRWLAPLSRTRPIVTRSNKSRLLAEELEARDVPALAVAGSAPGEAPLVRVFDNTSLQTVGVFAAMPLNFRGGINATLGDVNNDGKPEVIVATASGNGPAVVRVFDTSGNEIRTLPPIAVAGGLNVTSGDVNGDGNDDIIVSTVKGGLVGAFNGVTGELMGVIAPYGANFFGGVQVAVADVDGDGIDDIITAPEAGGAVVKAFRGITLEEFRTFDVAAGYTGPLNLAAGDVNNDGMADILLGTGTGVVPAAGVINGATGRLDSLFVVPVNASGGMTVGVGEDANGDAVAEILLGVGGTPVVLSISPTTNGLNGIGVLPGGLVDGGLISDPTPGTPTASNVAPTITFPATFAGNENGPLALTGISVADPDAGSGLVQVSLGVTNGTLSLETDGLTFTAGDGTEDAVMTFTGALGTVNAALAGLTYIPGDGYLGDDELTINVSDLGNTGAGGAKTATATSVIAVNNVNDAPLITSNGGGATAGTSVSEGTTAVTTVTATDTDAGSTLTYSIIGGDDAELFGIDADTGALSFILAPSFADPTDTGANNVYDVTVQVSDGTNTDTQAIAVTVTEANLAPVVTTSATATMYTVNAPGVIIDGAITVTDADPGDMIVGATVAGAPGDFAPGDVLAFNSVLATGFGISGSYDGVTTGVLTFTGTATAVQYEAVLRTVTFATSIAASVTLTFTFAVNDGDTTGSDTKDVAVTGIS